MGVQNKWEGWKILSNLLNGGGEVKTNEVVGIFKKIC